MNSIENLIQELKSFGFSQEQITEVMQIGEQEIVDVVLEDFAFNGDEKNVEEYLHKCEAAKDNPQEFSKLLNEIMGIHYGQENIEKTKEELLKEYLQNIIELTKQTKEIQQKYAQGDPETVKAVEETKNSPIVQDMAKKIEEDNKNPQDNG